MAPIDALFAELAGPGACWQHTGPGSSGGRHDGTVMLLPDMPPSLLPSMPKPAGPSPLPPGAPASLSPDIDGAVRR